MVLRVQQQLRGGCLLATPAALHVCNCRNHAAGQPHQAVHLWGSSGVGLERV